MIQADQYILQAWRSLVIEAVDICTSCRAVDFALLRVLLRLYDAWIMTNYILEKLYLQPIIAEK